MNEGALQLWHGVLFRQRADLTLESISPHVRQWTGLEPHLALQAIHPADRAKAEADQATFRLRHARTSRITWIQQRRRAVPGGYEGYWEDVTDRVRLTHELAETHWKATLGTATQRLVHDFNNLLTGILSLSDAYLLRLQADNPAREGMQTVNRNARQAADIVQQMAALFRERAGRKAHHNLAQIAAASADMLGRVLPKHSALKLDIRHESIAVYLDAADLKQVIVSLGLALTPPIHLEVALEQKQARLTINGLATPCPTPLFMAEAFAERNNAQFEGAKSHFTFRFPEADFSETERQEPWILLVGDDNDQAFKVADLLRRHSHQVVIGPEHLMHSSDYRFDASIQLADLAGKSDKEVLAAVKAA